MTIGGLVKEARVAHHMTQDELAQAVGTTKATVSRWETGDIKKMKASHMKAVAAVLDMDVMIFFRHEEVLLTDEYNIINAYRVADEGTKSAIRKLLDLKEENTK